MFLDSHPDPKNNIVFNQSESLDFYH